MRPLGTILAALLPVTACAGPILEDPFVVVLDGKLGPNIELGVDSSLDNHRWVDPDTEQDELRLSYPAGEGAGWVTFLLTVDDPQRRPTEDLRAFQTLQLEIAGTWGSLDATYLAVALLGAGAVRETRICTLPPALPEQRFGIASIPLTEIDPDGAVRSQLFSPAQLVLRGNERAEVRLRSITLFKEAVRAPSACREAP